jgi:thymidylate synthase
MDQIAEINKKPIHPSCTLEINGPLDINDIRLEQFTLKNYVSEDRVTAPMAV